MTMFHNSSPCAAPLRILVVDDEPDMVSSTTMMLELWGHTAFGAGNGSQALQATCLHQPDVILLDLAMPGVSGFEVARRIREASLVKRPFLIALSGHTNVNYRRQAAEAGVDIAFAKPVDCKALKAVLERFGQLASPPPLCPH
jgi:two-component system, chemotaxis family, CheB/CheR fusion protein